MSGRRHLGVLDDARPNGFLERYAGLAWTVARLRATALALLLATSSGTSLAQPVTVVLGTATPGGGFPAYGAALVEAVRRADPELAVETRNTKGSTENVPLLEAGALDLGLVTGEVAEAALREPGPTRLTVLAAMYPSPGLFAVRADSPYRAIADLRGRPVVFGARGSGLVVLARQVLEGLGLDLDRDFQAIYLDRVADGPPLVLDGRAAAIWGGGLGWPGFAAVAEGPAGARFLVPDDAEVRAILARHPTLQRLTVPAGTYPGQSEPLSSVGSWSLVLARPTLDQGIAYRLARALHRGEGDLAARPGPARETSAANTLAAVGDPGRLHPGVRRYLTEAGLLR